MKNIDGKYIDGRNYGIDFLRNVSMCLVILLHVLEVSGLLVATQDQPMKYETLKIFDIVALCSVNCYGLISGYVGYKSKFRLASIVTLWLQVCLYSAGIGILFYILMPDTVSLKELVKLFLPVLFQRYWYFTAYFALFFTMPLLNVAIERLPRKQFEISFGILLFLLTVCQQTVIMSDSFGTDNGYSYLWLAVLYCVGGYLGKYQIKLDKAHKKAWCACVYVGCIAVCWIAQFFMRRLDVVAPERLEAYNSPFILLMSIALLLLFSNMKLPAWLAKTVSFLTPASFGVYLIHTHPLIFHHILKNSLVAFAEYSVGILLLLIIILVLGIYILCAGIDLLRYYLFRTLKIKQRLSNLEEKLFPNMEV